MIYHGEYSSINLSLDTEGGYTTGPGRTPSSFLRPKKLSFHNTNTASRTADFVGYDSVAGLTLLQEYDDLILLG